MWGFQVKYLKPSMALLAALVGMSLVWTMLPRLWAVGATLLALTFLAIALIFRDAVRQTKDVTSEDSVLGWESASPGLRRDWKGVRTTYGGPQGRVPRSARPGRPPARAARPGPTSGLAVRSAAGAAVRSAAGAADRGSRRRRGTEVLDPDVTVTLAEERRAAGIDDLFAALDLELVGLVPVKKKVEEIGSLLLVDRARQRFGLSASRPNLHMCFTGAPGTGKTTVALKLADLLRRLGYLEKGHLVHAMRDDLVGEYIGHTAPKTKAVLERAMGGVLFIDEAYSLYRAEDSKDYGQECIDILLQVMENDRDKLVVILAGYKDRMDHFFDSNPGMGSRIAHHLDFADYTLDELLAIGQLMLDQSSYYLSSTAAVAFREFLTADMHEPRFANARSVRNELERSRLRHAYRLAADPDQDRSRDDLMRLEPADIGVPRLVNRFT
jgi:probable Rubsico expression protein CbbX